jgi:hypothetical protein
MRKRRRLPFLFFLSFLFSSHFIIASGRLALLAVPALAFPAFAC